MSKESIFYIGQRVYIKCPAYYKGRKIYGTIKDKKTNEYGVEVLLIIPEGKRKGTNIACIWVTPVFS